MSLFLYLCALGMTDVAFHLIDNYEDVMIDDISITGYNAMDFACMNSLSETFAFVLWNFFQVPMNPSQALCDNLINL